MQKYLTIISILLLSLHARARISYNEITFNDGESPIEFSSVVVFDKEGQPSCHISLHDYPELVPNFVELKESHESDDIESSLPHCSEGHLQLIELASIKMELDREQQENGFARPVALSLVASAASAVTIYGPRIVSAVRSLFTKSSCAVGAGVGAITGTAVPATQEITKRITDNKYVNSAPKVGELAGSFYAYHKGSAISEKKKLLKQGAAAAPPPGTKKGFSIKSAAKSVVPTRGGMAATLCFIGSLNGMSILFQ